MKYAILDTYKRDNFIVLLEKRNGMLSKIVRVGSKETKSPITVAQWFEEKRKLNLLTN